VRRQKRGSAELQPMVRTRSIEPITSICENNRIKINFIENLLIFFLLNNKVIGMYL
jgi:hypothetical protein